MAATEAAATSPQGSPEEDTVAVLSQKLAAVEMTECDEAAKYLISAILGFETDNADWNKTVLLPRVHQIPQEVETRLRLVGIVDSEDMGDSSDSRIAGYFVTLASRVIRLATYKTVQLEFFGHCVVALTALYAIRVDVINSTYPDVVLNVAEAMVQFLKKAKLAASVPSGKPAPASSGAKRRSRLTAEVPQVDTSTVTAETVSSLPHVDGIRKAAVSFLHAVKPHVARLTRSILEDEGYPQEVKDDYKDMNVEGSVKALLANAAEFESTIEDQWNGRYAVASAFIPLFVAPLFIICAVAGALLFWSPVIYPPTLIMFPALRPILDLSPQWEWIRYALSALSAFSIIALVFYMANFTPGRDMGRAAACAHAFLTNDGDVKALYLRQPGEICVPVALLSGDAAAVAAATSPGSAATSSAPASSQAGGAGDSASAGDDADGFTVDTMQSLGFSPEEAQQAINLFNYAMDVEGTIIESTGNAADSSVTAASGGAGDSTASTGGGGGAAAALSQAEGAASARVIPVPESLLDTLYQLYHRLEEVGEAETADAVALRINFIEQSMQNGRVAQYPDEQFMAPAEGEEEDGDGDEGVATAGATVAGNTGEPETPTSVGVRDTKE